MGAMGTAGARIGYACWATAHLDRNGAFVDHLTIHEKEWAYCPMDVRKTGHEWKPTGGVILSELEMVVRAKRERVSSEARAETRPKDR
jgi:hypothetical protein